MLNIFIINSATIIFKTALVNEGIGIYIKRLHSGYSFYLIFSYSFTEVMYRISAFLLFFTFLAANLLAQPNNTAPETAAVDQITDEADGLISNGSMGNARQKITEAKNLSEQIGYENGLARSDALLGKVLHAQGKYDSAAIVLEPAYERYKETATGLSLGNLLATNYRYRSEYIQSMNLYLEILERAIAENDEHFISAIHQNLAVVYENLNDRSQALNHYQKSLEIAEARSDTLTLATLLNNIGDLYRQMENFEEAESYMDEAYHYSKMLNSPEKLINYHINNGVLKRAQKKHEEAIHNYHEAIKLADQIGNVITPVQALFNIGNIYLDKEEFSKAEEAFRESLEKSRELNIRIGVLYNQIGLGDVYSKTGDPETALGHFETAHNLIEEMGVESLKGPLLDRLSEANEKTGQYEEAYRYLKQFSQLSDSLNTVEQEKEKAKFETLLGLRNEKQQNELLQEKVYARNQMLIIGGISLLVVGIASFILFRMYRKQKRQSVELDRMNRQLNKLYKELEAKNSELEDLSNTKDKLFAVLAHDLRSPVSKLYSIMMIIREGGTDELDMEEVMNELDLRFNQTMQMLENYLSWAQTQMEGLKPEMQNVNLQELSGEIVELMNQNATAKKIVIKNEINEPLLALADKNMMRVVLQNLVSNAIKFSSEGDSVLIHAEKSSKEVRIAVRDEGVGIPDSKQEKLFRAFNHSTSGTNPERRTGQGLTISRDITEMQNGRIWFESAEGKGSTFYVELQKETAKGNGASDTVQKFSSAQSG